MTIRMDAARLRLGDADVLRDVSIELTARTTAVLGENGSGKSSFARVVAGLLRPTSGSVSVLGLDTDKQASELRRRTAMVFSNPDAQILMPTVAEDVAFSLRGGKRPADEVRELSRRRWRSSISRRWPIARRTTSRVGRSSSSHCAVRSSAGPTW